MRPLVFLSDMSGWKAPRCTLTASSQPEPVMKSKVEPFRVREGRKPSLSDSPTRTKPLSTSDADYASLLSEHTARLSALQNLLYADNRYSLLLVFQALDAAGKDGAIRHIMSGVNPQGCQVFSFKHP